MDKDKQRRLAKMFLQSRCKVFIKVFIFGAVVLIPLGVVRGDGGGLFGFSLAAGVAVLVAFGDYVVAKISPKFHRFLHQNIASFFIAILIGWKILIMLPDSFGLNYWGLGMALIYYLMNFVSIAALLAMLLGVLIAKITHKPRSKIRASFFGVGIFVVAFVAVFLIITQCLIAYNNPNDFVKNLWKDPATSAIYECKEKCDITESMQKIISERFPSLSTNDVRGFLESKGFDFYGDDDIADHKGYYYDKWRRIVIIFDISTKDKLVVKEAYLQYPSMK